MIKFWFYIIVFVCFAVVGLAIGSANDDIVTFDFLMGKSQLSVASVLVVGVIFGFIVGVYASLWLCIKLWVKANLAKSQASKLSKQLASLEKSEK